MRPKVQTQFMADLPAQRMQPYTPHLLYTSCDYFGQVKVKLGRNRTSKHYGVVFTCCPLWVGYRRQCHRVSPGSEKILCVPRIRKIHALRQQPANGGSRAGIAYHDRELGQGQTKGILHRAWNEMAVHHTIGTPIHPMVKSIKTALKKAIGDSNLTPFELYTCLLEAANLVNQRPIGRIPQDPDDGSYLCPNDILMGRATNEIPQGPFRHTNYPRHRFEFCQKIVESFWKRWSSHNWCHERNGPQKREI